MPVVHKLFQRGANIFEQDFRLWQLSLRVALIIAAVPIVIILGVIAVVPVPDVFVRITAENSVMEWLQFLLVLGSSLIFARLSLRLFQSRQAGVGALCLLITLGTFFVAGEEIAWGQHIFGWSTPEELEAVNVQRETTLHNISSAHPIFVYGVMLAGLYGTFMPLLRAGLPDRIRSSPMNFLLIPPLFLVPAFFMPFAYRFSRLVLGVDHMFPHLIFQITKFSEVSELCLYFGLAVFAWINLRRLQTTAPSKVRHLFADNKLKH